MSSKNLLSVSVGLIVLLSVATVVADEKITMSLEKNEIEIGEQPFVTFTPALPPEGEKYWIALAEADSPDETKGQWEKLNTWTSSTKLKPAPSPGNFELRLHGGSPEKPFHVIARIPIKVVERKPAKHP